jgi:TRAP-type mannitol/chloroaromatic compound transport system permease small subunit
MSHRSRPNNIGSYIASAVFNGVFLWVMNQLPLWKPWFLLDSYADVLWAINMSLTVQIVLNLVLIFFHPLFFHYLTQAVFSLVSFIALLWIVRVFPLDFSARPGEWLNLVVRIVLIVGLVGTAIGGITNLVHFFRALFRGEPPRSEDEEREEE